MSVKLQAPLGGSVELSPANTASNYTLTVPAQTGTIVATDSSGNVGIGTSSPSQKLDVLTATSGYQRIQVGNGTNNAGFGVTGTGYSYNGVGANETWVYSSAGALNIGSDSAYPVKITINGSERMRIDSSGNVGIGTSSPAFTLDISQAAPRIRQVALTGTNSSLIQLGNTGGTAYVGLDNSAGGLTSAYALNLYHAGAYPIVMSTNGTERMRIDSSGNLLVGTTSFLGGSTVGLQINATNNTSTAYAQLIKNSSGTEIFQMRCNGGLGNYSANNVNLSDERVKTDIKLAGSYLDKICAIPVKTFKYKDQTDDLLNLGVIAQDVEVIAPELVDVDGFGETPEDGIPLKAIYQTDLQYALMKCIQEQQAIITELKTRIEALENK